MSAIVALVALSLTGFTPVYGKAPTQAGAAPLALAGLTIGMTISEAEPILRSKGYTGEPIARGQIGIDWATVINREEHGIDQRIPLTPPRDAPLSRTYDGPSGVELRVNYAPFPQGSVVTKVVWQEAVSVMDYDSVKRSLSQKYTGFSSAGSNIWCNMSCESKNESKQIVEVSTDSNFVYITLDNEDFQRDQLDKLVREAVAKHFSQGAKPSF